MSWNLTTSVVVMFVHGYRQSLISTLGYGCSEAVHFQAKSTPNLELDSRKVEKWIISWKKNTVCWLCIVKVAKPFAGFSAFRHFRIGWNDVKYNLAAKYRGQCRILDLFWDEVLQDSRPFNLEAKTTVSGETQCLLAIGENKKASFSEWPPP